MDEDSDLGVALQCNGDGGRSRARRDASKLDALGGELIDESCGERLRYIHRIYL